MSLTIGSALASGLAGLDVASRRLATASGNIANVRSLAPQGAGEAAGFRPLELQQVSDARGTPRAVVRTADVSPLKTFEPASPDADANGIVSRANVSLEREFGELIIAQRAFEASLAAISIADKMLGSLFDEEA